MPMLGKEPDLFPPDLLSQEVAGDWWALHTLPRREKDLMRRLKKKHISYYSPVVSREYRSPAGRLRTSHLLLFPGYVFLHGTAEDRVAALTTNCVANCLNIVDRASFLSELRQIQQVVASGIDLTPEGQIEPGDAVRVKSGPMTGVIGTVVERRGQKRLLVQINFIQQGASMELKDIDVEPYTL